MFTSMCGANVSPPFVTAAGRIVLVRDITVEDISSEAATFKLANMFLRFCLRVSSNTHSPFFSSANTSWSLMAPALPTMPPVWKFGKATLVLGPNLPSGVTFARFWNAINASLVLV